MECVHFGQQVDVVLLWYCFKGGATISFCRDLSRNLGTLFEPYCFRSYYYHYIFFKNTTKKKTLSDTLNPNNPFIAVHFYWQSTAAEIVWPSWHLSEISCARIPHQWNKHLWSSSDKPLTVGRKKMETEGVTDGRIESKLDLWGRRLTCHCRWPACLWANISRNDVPWVALKHMCVMLHSCVNIF